MGVIGIYDWDFFNYSPVIPNLECAKLCAYHKKKKDITLLTPKPTVNLFQRLYLRKDYNDGLYPEIMHKDNVVYGGRSFSDKYVPMKLEIENIKPDFSDYVQYGNYFGTTQANQMAFKKIMRAAHARLSLDERNINTRYDFEALINQDTSGLILHDYNLGQVEGAYEFLKDFSQIRFTLNGERVKPILIGNKFPIITYNSDDFSNWMAIGTMSLTFYLQHRGLLSAQCLDQLKETRHKTLTQIEYLPFYGIREEKYIIGESLIELLQQLLFLKENRISIQLSFELAPFCEEIQTLLKLFTYYAQGIKNLHSFSMPNTTTFYRFCSSKSLQERKSYIPDIPSIEEIKNAFAYIRVKNYELFNMFYQVDKVKLEGGRLIND